MSGEEKCKEYRSNNYLVIRIGKEKLGTDWSVAKKTFKSLIDAIEKDKGYNQVTGGIAKLKRQPLISQIYNFKEEKDAAKCEERKIKITNQFIAYWDTYIAPSFIRYLNGETNDIDLSPNQLGEAFTELSAAINAVETLSSTDTAVFILPNQNAGNQMANQQTVEARKTGISNIILGFDCPSPPAGTEESQTSEGTETSDQ